MCASPEVLDDACAYAWAEVVRRPPRPDSPIGWLIVVAEREAWRLRRLEQRTVSLDGDVAERITAVKDDGGPHAFAEHRDRLVTIAATLTERQRRLVGLHAAGHTYAEIAGTTCHSYRTVERQL